MTKSKVIVMDIETIPLPQSMLYTGESTVVPILQEIVCISYIELDDRFEVKKIRTLGLPEMSEKAAISAFVGEVSSDTMVVTWGGRGFDIPVLLYRAMVNGIKAKALTGKEFSNRYNPLSHLDLQDDMTFFGAVRKIGLDYTSAVLGLPGKMEVKASSVHDLIVRNRFNSVRSYCVTDVVQTLVVFLRWAYTKGLSPKNEVNNALDSLLDPDIYDEYSFASEKEGVQLVINNCDWDSLKIW